MIISATGAGGAAGWSPDTGADPVVGDETLVAVSDLGGASLLLPLLGLAALIGAAWYMESAKEPDDIDDDEIDEIESDDEAADFDDYDEDDDDDEDDED